jgi:hypothetical protein
VSDYTKFFQAWRRRQQAAVHPCRATLPTSRRPQYQGVCTIAQVYFIIILKGFYQNRLKKWSKDKLDLNIRSLIFAFEENKMKLKFNNPPCQQYRCVCQQWQKHLLKQVKIWTYVISFRDINKRGCIQTEYSVRHEDSVLQN